MLEEEGAEHVPLMRVHLFVPCYVDQVRPEVAFATATVLRRAGCEAVFDAQQTCCGQPQANSGDQRGAAVLARRHLDLFRRAPAGEAVVCPSGSCTSMVRTHYRHLGLDLDARDQAVIDATWELSDFLVNRLGITRLGARFPHRVGLHRSCHGLRELGLGCASELMGPRDPGPTERLLAEVEGLVLVEAARRDECCGFGGTFAVAEPELSARMGEDRLDQFTQAGAEWITAADFSCLMHLDGLAARRGGPRALHLAEILASR